MRPIFAMFTSSAQDLLTSAALVEGLGWGNMGVCNSAALIEVGKSYPFEVSILSTQFLQ
jgi:hypothetical protein